jgi:hypothetical protein
MRGADARSAQIGGPDSISQCFQVSAYSREPYAAILARNLLSKDDWREALSNEASEDRLEVSFIGFSPAQTRRTKRLTGQ